MINSTDGFHMSFHMINRPSFNMSFHMIKSTDFSTPGFHMIKLDTFYMIILIAFDSVFT